MKIIITFLVLMTFPVFASEIKIGSEVKFDVSTCIEGNCYPSGETQSVTNINTMKGLVEIRVDDGDQVRYISSNLETISKRKQLVNTCDISSAQTLIKPIVTAANIETIVTKMGSIKTCKVTFKNYGGLGDVWFGDLALGLVKEKQWAEITKTILDYKE